MEVKPHKISLAVWDLSSPLIVNSGATIKVGAKCSAGCVMSGCEIEVLDQEGARISSARLGSESWSGTSALYWAEADFRSPASERAHSWSVKLTPAGLESPHESVSFPFGFIAVPPPEHSVMLRVVEQKTGTPVADVQVRLGPHKGTTAESGSAKLEVPKGSYELNVWKAGYEAQSTNLEVSSDTSIQLEILPTPEPETPQRMG